MALSFDSEIEPVGQDHFRFKLTVLIDRRTMFTITSGLYQDIMEAAVAVESLRNKLTQAEVHDVGRRPMVRRGIILLSPGYNTYAQIRRTAERMGLQGHYELRTIYSNQVLSHIYVPQHDHLN